MRYWLRRTGTRTIQPKTQELTARVQSIRERSDVIAFTGQSYGNNWRGVYNGALEMFPGHLLAIPHRDSQNILPDAGIERLTDAIAQSAFQHVVFTGYGDCLKALIIPLSMKMGDEGRKKIRLIYHGSFSQNADRSRDTGYLREIISLQQEGIIGKIGFMKKGMAETLQSITRLDAAQVLTVVKEDYALTPQQLPGLNAGVFTHDTFRKNLHNQVAAALMIREAGVHVHDGSPLAYLPSDARVHAHPFTDSYDDFLRLLGSMTINFYVTFSECYGMVIAESLALGVPCLASNSSGFFDYDAFLAKALVVEEFDNSEAIYRKALDVLSNREEIAARGKEYVKTLNAIARSKLHDFLNS
jgi:glycosyltransferase involved in cell wall biosynthesis